MAETDWTQMQQEAIRRVRAMQERARRSVESTPEPDEPPPVPESAPPDEPPAETPSLLARITGKNTDSVLLWVLLLILWEDHSDSTLILALLYLIAD